MSLIILLGLQTKSCFIQVHEFSMYSEIFKTILGLHCHNKILVIILYLLQFIFYVDQNKILECISWSLSGFPAFQEIPWFFSDFSLMKSQNSIIIISTHFQFHVSSILQRIISYNFSLIWGIFLKFHDFSLTEKK